jgi:hypothetical protein
MTAIATRILCIVTLPPDRRGFASGNPSPALRFTGATSNLGRISCPIAPQAIAIASSTGTTLIPG